MMTPMGEAGLFFIGGTEKSGTTWMQALLDAHPQAVCRGEGQIVNHLVPLLGEALTSYGRRVKAINDATVPPALHFPLPDNDLALEVVRATVTALLNRYPAPPGRRAIGEKTPGNVRGLDLLRRLFPGARFVLMLRDGRDVVTSLWFYNRRISGDAPAMADLVARAAPVWAEDCRRALAFQTAHPDRAVLLRYEDLLTDAEGGLTSVLRLLGLDADPATVAACVAAARFETLSGGRRRGETDPASQFRRGVAGDWRDHFDAAAESAFMTAAGGMLARLGYD